MLLLLCCFCVRQICEEFYRVTTKDLLGTFRAALDKYSPQLLKLYRARKGSFGQDMENLLDRLDEQVDLSIKYIYFSNEYLHGPGYFFCVCC